MAQDPNAVAARWAQNMGSSTEKWKDGVNGVAVAPGQAAARQADVWAQNTIASKGKWATNVASVSLQDWKDAMLTKGATRIGAGAQASQSKFATFMGALLPQIDRVKGTLPSRGNLDANINRMVQFSRGMADWSYKK